jgi:hypothetical protein
MVTLGAQQIKSEDDISGFQRPLPGRYHVVVKHVDESFEKFDKVIVDFEILAGTVPNMEGRELNEFFACTDKAIPRLQRLALCLGLLKPGEPDKDVEFADAVGRDLVIEVEENNYKDKAGKEVNGVRVGYLGMWSTNNAAVADVPKATLEGGGSGGGNNDDDGGHKPLPSSAPITTGSAPTHSAQIGGDWDDI